MQRYGTGNTAARILLCNWDMKAVKSLVCCLENPFPDMKRIFDFYHSGTASQFGDNPRTMREISAGCGTDFFEQ